MRKQGFVKTSLWVPGDCADDLRLLVKILGATNGKYREQLAAFVRDHAGELSA